MENSDLLNAIVHYQQCLDKYAKRNNEQRMLYCISKLFKMPVTVEHLEQTGVGRTVNALRKVNGEVGLAAKSLVSKWKQMVVGEDELKDSPMKTEEISNEKASSEEKYVHSSSSHKENNIKSKHDEKARSSTACYDNEDDQFHEKRRKDESRHKKHERSEKKDRETKSHKHKSSKRRHDSDVSDLEKDYGEEKNSSKIYKHKSSKYKSEENISDEKYQTKIDKKVHHKEKTKRKYEDSDVESDYEEENVKRKKLSENEVSEDEVEQYETKRHSEKHRTKYKEERSSESQEKSKHESKHKHKDKRENHKVDKTKDDHKNKDKHLHKDKDDKSRSSSDRKSKEDKSSDKKSKSSSSKHHHSKEQTSKKSSSRSSSSNKGVPMNENGIGSGSGASFAEALGMLTPGSSKTSKKKLAVAHSSPLEKFASDNSPEPLILQPDKKLEPLDINVSSLLPEITPNYRPLGSSSFDSLSKNKIATEDEALSAILNSKISRTKVYSGNKMFWGKVPSLFDLCTHILQDNLDALEYTGGVPYSILKPVIERGNPDQLYMLEQHNPYLIEDTDELWHLHCQREFRNKKREELESWREMYMRCLDEREAKLKALTANIKQSQDKSLPVRQTKLAYVDSIVKPPRNIARKQAKHGTGAGTDKKPLVTPSARLSTLATAGAAGQVAVPNPGARAASTTGNSNAITKIKKAPLMQKTLAFMKNRCFRR